MPQVRIALSTKRFYSPHAMAGIGLGTHAIRVQSRVETRPTRARIKLGRTVKELCPAARAAICAVFVVVPILAGERRLRALLPGHMILFRTQFLTPLLIGFLGFFHGTSSLPDSAYTEICNAFLSAPSTQIPFNSSAAGSAPSSALPYPNPMP